jgi:hypothetical protein
MADLQKLSGPISGIDDWLVNAHPKGTAKKLEITLSMYPVSIAPQLDIQKLCYSMTWYAIV